MKIVYSSNVRRRYHDIFLSFYKHLAILEEQRFITFVRLLIQILRSSPFKTIIIHKFYRQKILQS